MGKSYIFNEVMGIPTEGENAGKLAVQLRLSTATANLGNQTIYLDSSQFQKVEAPEAHYVAIIHGDQVPFSEVSFTLNEDTFALEEMAKKPLNQNEDDIKIVVEDQNSNETTVYTIPWYKKTAKVLYRLTVATTTVLLVALAVTALMALMASGAFGPVVAAGVASAAAAISATVVLNALASVAVAISASVFAVATVGALISLQETFSPRSLLNGVENFFKVINSNLVKESYELKEQSELAKKFAVFADKGSKTILVADSIKGVRDLFKRKVIARFKTLGHGLTKTLAYTILAFPPIMMILASLARRKDTDVFKSVVEGKEPLHSDEDNFKIAFNTINTISAMHRLMPTGNAADVTFLRTVLNPVQWVQSTLLWMELVSMTLVDSFGQFVEPNPIAGLLRGAIHGVLGTTYFLLEPLKNIASIPARLVEVTIDFAIKHRPSFGRKKIVIDNDSIDADTLYSPDQNTSNIMSKGLESSNNNQEEQHTICLERSNTPSKLGKAKEWIENRFNLLSEKCRAFFSSEENKVIETPTI